MLNASRRGYYQWRKRKVKEALKQSSTKELVGTIAEIQQKVNYRYGSPRIHQSLRKMGHRHGRKRIARLMNEYGLGCRSKRAYKCTTKSKGDVHVAEDLVQRNFTANKPNELWTSDITYIRLQQGWVYLCVILDVYSRRIVGWQVDERMTQGLVLRTLYQATKRRKHHKDVIFHSDRGSQYKALSVVEFCQKHGIRRSMGESGTCYDNAITESFNASLKDEIVFPYVPREVNEVRVWVGGWIEYQYNMFRLYSSINYCSPMEFENLWWKNHTLTMCAI